MFQTLESKFSVVMEELKLYIYQTGGQMVIFNDKRDPLSEFCWVAPDYDPLLANFDFKQLPDFKSHNFVVGVSDYLLSKEPEKALISILHELGHQVDLECFDYDFQEYSLTYELLEYELRAWENGWKLAKKFGYTNLEAYLELARKYYSTYCARYLHISHITEEEIDERFSKLIVD